MIVTALTRNYKSPGLWHLLVPPVAGQIDCSGEPVEGVTVIVDVLPAVAPAVYADVAAIGRAKLGTGAAETVTTTAFDVLPVKLVSPAKRQ